MTIYGHLPKNAGGRFPLTGKGETDLYAYFAELSVHLKSVKGKVGMVLPSGIATDKATSSFSNYLTKGHLHSIYDFQNKYKFFPITGNIRFSLMTLGESQQPDYVFMARSMKDIEDSRRHVPLVENDISLMNPNSLTIPMIRTHRDLEICRKLYQNVPVFIRAEGRKTIINSWKADCGRFYHMSDDSHLFHEDHFDNAVPLYEGKIIEQYDDRFATFEKNDKGDLKERDVLDGEKTSTYSITPQYWVNPDEVKKKWKVKNYLRPWVLVYRDIASSSNSRTLVSTVMTTSYPTGNTLNMVMPKDADERLAACLLANLNALITDYCIKMKSPGSHVNNYLLFQIPILPPDTYSEQEIEFIASRVAKLTRNHDTINKVWLTDYPEYPFGTAKSRLEIRAQLDALYAKKYGLTRDELDFVLDPSEAESPDYPSETFPVLKREELTLYGEFRTRRLVLEAFDKLEKYGLEAFESAK